MSVSMASGGSNKYGVWPHIEVKIIYNDFCSYKMFLIMHTKLTDIFFYSNVSIPVFIHVLHCLLRKHNTCLHLYDVLYG